MHSSILHQSVTRLRSRVTESVIEDILASSIIADAGKHPVRTSVHASSVVSEDWCSREFVLGEFYPDRATTDPQDKMYTHLHNIFQHGWEVHRKWQRIFLSQGLAVFSEEKGEYELDLTHYDPEYMIYYSPDAIITALGKTRVVEIKGINTEEYQSVHDLPLEEAVKLSQTVKKARQQINLYMYLLHIEEGLILAEDKNTQAYRVWTCVPTQAVLSPLVKKITDHKRDHEIHARQGTLPPRYKGCTAVSASRARRCPMRDLCFSNELGKENVDLQL
jgi:hypothetical protein